MSVYLPTEPDTLHSIPPTPYNSQGILGRQLTLVYFITRLNYAGRLGENFNGRHWSTIVRLILISVIFPKLQYDFGCFNNQCDLIKAYQLRAAIEKGMKWLFPTSVWSKAKALKCMCTPTQKHTTNTNTNTHKSNTQTQCLEILIWLWIKILEKFGRQLFWVEFQVNLRRHF